jgi:hypothetical protein
MRNEAPPWERREGTYDDGPQTTYQIHRNSGVVETPSWRVATAWSGVGVKVTAVSHTEGRR